MLVDTHTHLYLPEFGDDGGASAVSRAIDAGVGMMIFPNVDLSTVEPMKRLAAEFTDNVRMAMGLHPTEARESWSEDTDTILADLADGTGYVAVGEIGIDMYWDKTFEREQMLSFDRQVSRAVELDLPIIIHCREGLDQVLEVLESHPKVKAVFHSFGGSVDDVERIRRHGDHYFGINGIVTFKNCKVRDVLPDITLDRLLLETDAPYLAPVPHRGRRNESAFMVHTAAHIAATLGLTIEQVAEATTANAKSFFNL